MIEIDERAWDYISIESESFARMLSTVSIILFAALVVIAIGFFFLLLFKRRPNKSLTLYPLEARQDLSDNEAEYFSYIKYNPEIKSIVLKQSQVFSKCVVTLVIKTKSGTVSMKRYNLTYGAGDVFCGIQIGDDVDEYRVILESIDKKTKKHARVDNQLVFNLIYAALVTVVFVVAAILYVYAMSFFLVDTYTGFIMCYLSVALVAIYVAIVVGGYLLFETLSKKGAF